MHLSLKNDLDELARLATGLERFGREENLAPETVQELNLALDELITNTISYGYDEGEGRKIDVHLENTGEEVSVTLSDDARSFNPFEAAEPDLTSPVEDRPIGGLGVFLVRQLMDSFTYAREDGKNVIRLRKSLRGE